MQKRKIVLLFLIVLLMCVFASALITNNNQVEKTICSNPEFKEAAIEHPFHTIVNYHNFKGMLFCGER